MNLGLIGFPSRNIGNVLAMALAYGASDMAEVASPSGRGVRFVYNNGQDKEHFSKVYASDNVRNRQNFVEKLKSQQYLYGEVDAISFISFLDTPAIYREDI